MNASFPAARNLLGFALALLFCIPQTAGAVVQIPEELQGVTTVDRRGSDVSLNLKFKNEEGDEVRLQDYFADGKPVLLTLNYYRCTMLCSEMLNGLTESLRTLEWTPGDNFRLVTVSIDPREKPAMAKAKRASYLESLDRHGAEWNFLTGSERDIHALAKAVGYRYKYDAETDQFAHPPAIMFLSPEGRVMQYLFGKRFKGRDLKFALMDAAEGKVGSTFEQLVWSCFHLDENSGQYTPFALGIMRLGGTATAVILAFVMFYWWRRERKDLPVAVTQERRPELAEQVS
jgi:protein SCO1/2